MAGVRSGARPRAELAGVEDTCGEVVGSDPSEPSPDSAPGRLVGPWGPGGLVKRDRTGIDKADQLHFSWQALHPSREQQPGLQGRYVSLVAIGFAFRVGSHALGAAQFHLL